MIYCLNAVSQLSHYFFTCLVQSGTQIREAAHVASRVRQVESQEFMLTNGDIICGECESRSLTMLHW